MSPETIINLKVYGTAFLISIGIMAVIWVYTGIKMKEFTAHIQKVLGPVFPDVKADGYNVSFKVYGFNGSMHFSESTKHSPGSTTFSVHIPAKYDPENFQKEERIFKVIIEEKGFFGTEYKSLSDVKKRLKIKADDPVLKQNLAYEDGLLSALRDIYVAADNEEISLTMNTDGIIIHCVGFIEDTISVQKIARSAVKVCEQALKIVARAGIQLSVPNPFQGVQDEPNMPRYSSLENRSDESLYDSLDGSLNQSADDIFEENFPVNDAPEADDNVDNVDNQDNELDGLEPRQLESSDSVESAPLAIQPREKLPPPPPRRINNDREKEREEDESMLFF